MGSNGQIHEQIHLYTFLCTKYLEYNENEKHPFIHTMPFNLPVFPFIEENKSFNQEIITFSIYNHSHLSSSVGRSGCMWLHGFCLRAVYTHFERI